MSRLVAFALLAFALLAAGCGRSGSGSAPARPLPAVTGTAAAPATIVSEPDGGDAPTSEPPASGAAATALPPTAAPSDTPEPAPTAAPRLWQLTTGGCCAQPSWSPDGAQVRFIDKPGPEAASGIWGVDVRPGEPGGAPELVTERLGIYSPDQDLVAYPDNGETIIERVADGTRWVAPSGGRAISFTPDGQQILWQVSSGTGDATVSEIWLAEVDGSNPRRIARLLGGGLSDWFPDRRRALISRRESPEGGPVLAVLDLESGAETPILTIPRQPGTLSPPRLRSVRLSPDGEWVAYQVTFAGDPAQDGLWVMRSDGRDARRLEVFGAFRWRAEGQLLVLPLEPGAASHRVVEVDAATGALRALTDPAVTPFRIASGYWSLSPDGRLLAFVAEEDRNIWVLELPPPGGGL